MGGWGFRVTLGEVVGRLDVEGVFRPVVEFVASVVADFLLVAGVVFLITGTGDTRFQCGEGDSEHDDRESDEKEDGVEGGEEDG